MMTNAKHEYGCITSIERRSVLIHIHVVAIKTVISIVVVVVVCAIIIIIVARPWLA